jgi:NTP pyrophosphatase (non-canonical NTP hydrolase)
MNIYDVDPSKLKESLKGKDRLEVLFELVKKQNSMVSDQPIDCRIGQKEWKDVLFCLTEELFEAANCLKIRPWVQTEYPVDYGHLYDELADSLWFFVCLLVKSGLDPEKTFDIFLRKYMVNEFRRESQY